MVQSQWTCPYQGYSFRDPRAGFSQLFIVSPHLSSIQYEIRLNRTLYHTHIKLNKIYSPMLKKCNFNYKESDVRPILWPLSESCFNVTYTEYSWPFCVLCLWSNPTRDFALGQVPCADSEKINFMVNRKGEVPSRQTAFVWIPPALSRYKSTPQRYPSVHVLSLQGSWHTQRSHESW